MFSFMEMQKDERVDCRFWAPTERPFVRNLHTTAQKFLKTGDDFLLLMDDDNPPQRNPLDLVFLGLDVVGLPTPVWNSRDSKGRPWYFNVMVEVKGEAGEPLGWGPADMQPAFDARGLKPVDSVGTGCVLIARRVLEDLFERCEGRPAEAPFMRLWNDQGDVDGGNDFMFCRRARQAGYRIWAHFDYTCDHYVTLSLNEVISRLGGRA
jgi:GT2 family glycosyltransferase